MDFSHVFNLNRWRRRFRSEEEIVAETLAAGRVPDATVDEVGASGDAVGFEGRALHSRPENGQGSGDPGGPNWAGWGV